MRVAMLEAARTVVLREVPIPSVQPGCILIRIAACGVCGTDIAVYEGHLPVTLPYSLGHEYVGTVMQAGEGVRGFSVGDHVAVNPNAFCGRCTFCQRGQVHLCKNRSASRFKSNGGFAEYTVVSTNIVHRLPHDLPLREAAFAEPLSCALHALHRVRFEPGDAAVILGAGTMGLLMLQLLRQQCAAAVVLSEPVALRREQARRLRADLVLDPLAENVLAEVHRLMPDGADLVAECSGRADATLQGLQLLKQGGTLLMVGVAVPGEQIPISPYDLVEHELAMIGAVRNPFSFSQAIALLASRRIQVTDWITVFALDQVVDAILAAKTAQSVKSMVVNDA